MRLQAMLVMFALAVALVLIRPASGAGCPPEPGAAYDVAPEVGICRLAEPASELAAPLEESESPAH